MTKLKTAVEMREPGSGQTPRQHVEAVWNMSGMHLDAARSLNDNARIEGRGLLASEQRDHDEHPPSTTSSPP